MSEAKQSHDLSAESALLGQLFSRPDAVLPELRGRLQARDFFSRQHALLFQAALDLDADAQPVDLDAVFTRLARRADHGLDVAELEQLKGFFALAQPSEDVEPLLLRVLARSRSRELLRRLETLLENARRSPEDLKRHLDETLAALLPIARELSREDADGLAALSERLRRAPRRRSSGFARLDAQERWFADGELVLLLGRTGHGKTQLLLNLAAHWLDEGNDGQDAAPLLYYSLEMPAEQLAARLLTLRQAQAQAQGRPLPKAWGERLQIRFTPRLDVERLAADALRRMAGARGGAVFVDALTALLPPPQARIHGRRDLELAEICRRLKELGVVLGCPVVAAVPARRDNLTEGEKPLRLLLARGAELHEPEVEDAIRWRRPRLEHLPEPGLEAHADVVLALLNYVADYQEELDPEHRQVFKSQPEATLELSALKHRHGGLHGGELKMQVKSGWIYED